MSAPRPPPPYEPSEAEVEAAARVIADELYDGLDNAFANKSEWNFCRGFSGGRFRDINEPFQDDYREAARAALIAAHAARPEGMG